MFAIVICLVLLMYTLTILSSMLCVLIVEGMSVVVNAIDAYGAELQMVRSLRPSRDCRSNLYFSDTAAFKGPEHSACTHPEHMLHW